MEVQLTLVDPNKELCDAWQTAFGNAAGVSVVCGRFEGLPAVDCMVSAANSFGLMDGGVDLAITRYFYTSVDLRNLTVHVQDDLAVGTGEYSQKGTSKGSAVLHR